jgi:predicted outer membrane repeat protein
LAVDANHASRVFYIVAGKDVTISGLTISNGKVISDFGGGIYNDHATLTLSGCTISGNSVDFGVGGGIYNDGADGSATLTVSNCTISGNSAYFGGGIYNWVGTVTVTNSTLSGNWAGNAGGGIRNDGTLTITNSTLSGNFCGNSADDHGGGIYNSGTLKIGDTILKAGPSGENVYNVQQLGSVTSLGYNLSSDNGGGYLTATGDRITTDPMLGPLQNNGGPTFTHLPESNSPAIDAGDPTLGMDQRGSGFVRVMNGRIDIGAVEVQAIPTPTPTPTSTPTPTPHGHKRH